MLTFILSSLIAICFYFLMIYLRSIVFVNKHRSVSSNTVRGFAFILDMIMINVFNLVFWIIKGFTNDVVKDELSLIVNRAFHGGGEGVGDLFVKTQFFMLIIYFVYSLVFELTSMRSTLIGYFLGLRVKTDLKKVECVSVLIRGVLKPISLVLLPIAFVFSYSNKERKWLHDFFAGTFVERVN